MSFKKIALAASIALGFGASAASASVMTFETVDNGHYFSDGSSTINYYNTYTGGNSPGSSSNSFYNFNVSALPSGQTITAASITFYANYGNYYSHDAFETVEIWDVTSTPGQGSSLGVYQDLMTGVKYGEANVYSAQNYAPMPSFSVALDSAAFSDILADGFFSLGAHLSTLTPGYYQLLWTGSDYGKVAARLSVTLQSSAAIPEPATFALVGVAALGLLAARRRKA